MNLLDPNVIIALTALMGTTLVTFALLKAWQDWIALKRCELSSDADSVPRTQNKGVTPDANGQMSVGAARIELADMKERIKKLEAIASGVEL